jgi:hypothetical protein
MMARVTIAGGGGGAGHEDRQRRRSNWIEAAVILGVIGMAIALDWVLNGRLTYLGPVLIAIPAGLAVGAVLRARPRRSDPRV